MSFSNPTFDIIEGEGPAPLTLKSQFSDFDSTRGGAHIGLSAMCALRRAVLREKARIHPCRKAALPDNFQPSPRGAGVAGLNRFIEKVIV
jgi:hypothetical protein